ncbi:DUF4012 domain-containing protein [Patescibacteria group bacterium]|nr:DUF4012 domain-containing protein [Patescibacteria group bacterium]
MEGLEKIDLPRAVETNNSEGTNSPLPLGAKSTGRKFLFKKPAIILACLLILLGVLFVVIFLPARKTYSDARITYEQAKGVYDALKKENVSLASDEITKTKQDLTKTQNDFRALAFLRFVPVAGGYYNDFYHLTKAGSYSLDAVQTLVDAVKPYADVLGLKGKGSFVMGSAQQRIQTAVLTMGKVTPKIDDIAKSLELAKSEIDQVDPNHYPGLFGGDKIRGRLSQVKTLADNGVTFIDQARPLIKVLPSLLGVSGEKKYLVLFQNDKELRPTGGFITAYSIFKVDKGNISVVSSDDIYNLDNRVPHKSTAPSPILKYLPNVYKFNLRDTNLSPDFIDSMKTFNSLYNTIPGRTKVDGIIALDTNVLVATIKILNNDVVADGIHFNTNNDKRCDCPQVIYELENSIARPVGYVTTTRKNILGALLYSIMQKSLESSPKLYWGKLLQALITQTSQKHILFDLYNPSAQQGIEALNAAGRIKAFDGDYLHINEANFGGAKSNLYVKEAVTQNIQVDSSGVITNTVTINYKNPYPPSDCSLARGGLCLNAVLRDWIRVYVPKGSQLMDSKGSEVKVTSYNDLGKTVFEGFLTVRPLGIATYTLTYRLPFKVKGTILPLLIQKQPGTDGNQYTILLNGKTVDQFALTTDKEINLKL